jgi:hypothetical protein
VTRGRHSSGAKPRCLLGTGLVWISSLLRIQFTIISTRPNPEHRHCLYGRREPQSHPPVKSFWSTPTPLPLAGWKKRGVRPEWNRWRFNCFTGTGTRCLPDERVCPYRKCRMLGGSCGYVLHVQSLGLHTYKSLKCMDWKSGCLPKSRIFYFHESYFYNILSENFTVPIMP